MNTDGGAIIVGVRDNGEVKGLEKSLKNTDDALKLVADKFIVHIRSLFWACTRKFTRWKENILWVYMFRNLMSQFIISQREKISILNFGSGILLENSTRPKRDT